MRKILAIAAISIATLAVAENKATENQVPKTLEIRTEVVQAVLKYLDTRPHAESRQLIDAIQQDANAYIAKMNALKKKTDKPKAVETPKADK